MKLLRLDLLAVGPFTGVSLDLSAGDAGLHVVVGPNEAGKSSALRAVAALLYGFGTRLAGENAVHDAADVRVGGTLRHSDGTDLAVVRRRGTARTLLDATDGKTPLRDDALSRFLGAVDRGTFDGFFGLGHASLRAGAADLLRSDGQVGQALFTAGAGGKPLRVALDHYLKQAAELYVPSGKNQAVPRAQAEFRDARKAVDAASLPPEEWTDERTAHDQAQAEAVRVRTDRRAVTAERDHLDRVRRAVPLVDERSALLVQRALVADAPVLPPDFAARRAAAEQARSHHARSAADARRRLDRVAVDLDALTVPDALLARVDAVDDLAARLKGHQQVAAALPAQRIKADAALADVARLVLDLRPGADVGSSPEVALAAADGLRLNTARRNRITELAAASERLAERRAAAVQAVADAAAAHERQSADLDALPPSTEVSGLDAAVRAATRAGDPDRDLADARAAAARDAGRADAARRALPLVAGPLADVEALPVPSPASVDAAAGEQAGLDAGHARLAAEVDRLDRRRADADHQLAALRLAGPVPTEAELTAARADRDALWADVRRGGPTGPIADRYESAVGHADAVADGLRRESARVAQQATLTLDREELGRSLSASRDQLSAAAAARAAAEVRWRQAWAAAGVDPLPPAEMRAWLGRHADLCRAADAARVAAAAVASRVDQVAAHRAAVAAALGEPAGDGPLGPLLERARSVVEQARDTEERRRAGRAVLRAGQADAGRRAEAVAAADADLARWHDEWAAAVVGLGLAAGAGPAEARAVVDRCDALARATELARRLAADRQAAEADVDRFAADAVAVAAEVAPEFAGSPAAIVTALRQAVESAQAAAVRRDALRQQRGAAASAVEDADAALAAAGSDLADLCRTAGCPLDALPEVERRAAERRDLDDRLRQVDRELLTVNHGEPADALVAEAAAADGPALADRLAELDTAAAALDDRRRAIDQRIGRAAAKLEGWTGGDAAAAAADRAQQVLAAAREAAGRYLRLRLAAGVLRQGIERHRQRKQGPLLGRAGGLFAGLTLGSFAALDVDFADGDQPVLVAVRPDGRRLAVDQLSDGSRDQLYLSLRLAALEDFVARNEPVPLVVDDVLVHFDDARSRAALAALGELSRRTQVILFTHHDRVADLAAEAAGGAAVIHRLG